MFSLPGSKKYRILYSNGVYKGIRYVCSTCCGNECSDCRMLPPDYIRSATYIPETTTDIAHFIYGDPISNIIHAKDDVNN